MRYRLVRRGVGMGIALVLLLSAAGLALAAENALQLEWWTVDAGGGTSASSTYSLSGTLGQPDAASGTAGLSSSSYTLEGGFWPGGAVSSYALHLPLVLRP